MTRLRNFTGRDLWLLLNGHPVQIPAEGRASVHQYLEPAGSAELDWLDGVRLDVVAEMFELRGLPALDEGGTQPVRVCTRLVWPSLAIAAAQEQYRIVNGCEVNLELFSEQIEKGVA